MIILWLILGLPGAIVLIVMARTQFEIELRVLAAKLAIALSIYVGFALVGDANKAAHVLSRRIGKIHRKQSEVDAA